MIEPTPLIPLHLHTVDSLCVDLVSGRPIGVGSDNLPFQLDSGPTRGVLDWYRRSRTKWLSPVSVADAELIVEAVKGEPPVLAAAPTRPANDAGRLLTLVKVEAHRFAGLHAFGDAVSAPPNFIFEPQSFLMLFEGWNGSGKTSLLNAVLWCLTGQLLRPQRPPTAGTEEFDCVVEAVTQGEDTTSHRLSSVTPLPDPRIYRPSGWVVADTWVELTFEDQTGARLPVVRRSQTRTPRGKLDETISNLDALGIDPAGLRIGTTMPGLLQFIQIGGESELGKAIAELTGLSPLVDLASHANRARRKIAEDFSKSRNKDIKAADEAYGRTADDLRDAATTQKALSDLPPIPAPDGAEVEAGLERLKSHLETAKAQALQSAKDVLGEEFEPDIPSARSDLEHNISPALLEVQAFGKLDSAARLASLAKLDSDEIKAVRGRLSRIRGNAEILGELAADPSSAGRLRLYARVATWLKEHPENQIPDDNCAVCGGLLKNALDPVTGKAVHAHLTEARDTDAELLSQTIRKWEKACLGELAKELPAALQAELNRDLPNHPRDLVRHAVVEELFSADAFSGVLKGLKARTETACDEALESWAPLDANSTTKLPGAFGDACELECALARVEKALAFSSWRRANDASASEFRNKVLGRVGQEENPEPEALCTRLKMLQSIVQGAEPITNALTASKRLEDDLGKRRTAEGKLADYKITTSALDDLIGLGQLAQQQVEQLRTTLHDRAIIWRDRVYAGAFPSTQLALVDAAMSSTGKLDILVGAYGVSAPAQHIANASALRASLVGFYLAFWEHVMAERGGLRLLLLDDPQELLDAENRDRLATTITDLVAIHAQVFVTTYDSRFAAEVAHHGRANAVCHHSVLPVTRLRPTLEIPLSVLQINKLQHAYEVNPDDESICQQYVSECRTFIEARLGDFFDDAAYPAAVSFTLKPTFADHLQRLRGLVGNPPNDLFRAPPLRALCDDTGLVDGAPLLALMNKAHHRKHEIRPGDVAPVADAIVRVRKAVEKAHEACRLWRRRVKLAAETLTVEPISAWIRPSFSIAIHPDLAAFTRGAPEGATQEEAIDILSGAWFAGKSLFYLRNDNFGFAAPSGSIAIVEEEPSTVEDRRLVIARRGQSIFARRLLRSQHSGLLSLAAETPDPRRSAKTLQLEEGDVALHRVVGVLFDPSIPPPIAKSEAIQIAEVPALRSLSTAYRIREDSAVPLALPGQIALGGRQIPLNDLGTERGSLVALFLDDGSSVFKRVGVTLPNPLGHLRQFESIGGLGISQTFSVGKPQPGIRTILYAMLIIGVLYTG